LNHCFWLISRLHHTREGGGCPRLRRLSVPNARKRLRTLSEQDARRVGDGRWKMEDERRVWAVGGRVAHGLSPQPSLRRMEKGRRGIARRPVVLTGIGVTESTSSRHDASDKTGSGSASYSVGRASPVTSGTIPRLTRTSTGCGRPACLVVALSRRRMCWSVLMDT